MLHVHLLNSEWLLSRVQIRA